MKKVKEAVMSAFQSSLTDTAPICVLLVYILAIGGIVTLFLLQVGTGIPSDWTRVVPEVCLSIVFMVLGWWKPLRRKE